MRHEHSCGALTNTRIHLSVWGAKHMYTSEQCLCVFVSGPGNTASSSLALSLDVHMANKQRKHVDLPFPVFVGELSQTSSVFV